MIKYYLKMAEFNIWGNQLFRQSLITLNKNQFENIETPYGSLLDLVVHIFGAIDLWLNRINGNSPKTIKTANEYGWLSGGWAELAQNWEKSDDKLYIFIKSLEDNLALTRRIKYTSTEGDNYEASLNEILTHLSHHSMYHRGQIAMLLRQHKLTPVPANDAIYFFLSNSSSQF